MDTKQILLKARKKIEDPKHWTQRAVARAANGRSVLANSPEAVSFCLVGALLVVGGYDFTRTVALGVFESITGYRSLGGFNDTHTHEEVLAALDEAIAREG